MLQNTTEFLIFQKNNTILMLFFLMWRSIMQFSLFCVFVLTNHIFICPKFRDVIFDKENEWKDNSASPQGQRLVNWGLWTAAFVNKLLWGHNQHLSVYLLSTAAFLLQGDRLQSLKHLLSGPLYIKSLLTQLYRAMVSEGEYLRKGPDTYLFHLLLLWSLLPLGQKCTSPWFLL